MSVASNQAPIQKIPHSQSNKSLFTENSQDSDHRHDDVPVSKKLLESNARQKKPETAKNSN